MPSTPIFGHLGPMLAVAKGLTDRGHSVTILTGGKYRAMVETAGLRFVALPTEIDYDDNDFDSFLPGRDKLSGLAAIRYDLIGLFIGTIPTQYRALQTELASGEYDAVIAEAGFLGTVPLMRSFPRAERLPVIGVSAVPVTYTSVDTAPFGPALAPGNSVFSRLRNRVMNKVIHAGPLKPVQEALIAAMVEVGAPAPDGNFFDHFVKHDVTLQLAPPGIEYPRRELPASVRFIGPLRSTPKAATTLPSWWDDLQSGPPVVHVTQGTLDNSDLGKLVAPAIRGLAAADVIVVASTGGKPVEALLKHFPDGLPANARVAEFLPYNELLPLTDVVVTNGGFGGVQQALAHGVPLVVSGATEDKPEVAVRVAWSGSGQNLGSGRPRPAQVRRAVLRVLDDPSYRAAAGRLMYQISNLGDPLEAIAAAVHDEVGKR